MSLVCVTAPSRISVTLATTSGVCTNTALPYDALPGAEVIVGRAPLKRYGGSKTRTSRYPLPPALRTPPPGRSRAGGGYRPGTLALAPCGPPCGAGFQGSGGETG